MTSAKTDMVLPEAIPDWKYFPLPSNSKVPDIAAWQNVATDDREQLAKWAIERPGCNWACAMGPSGLSAFDLDGGPIGENSLAEFEIVEGCLPLTREHRSARGGRHLIFSDPKRTLRNSSNRLGPKLDTRGGNGFILVPPSTFEGGAYELLQNRPVAALPEFVVSALGRARDHAKAAADVTLDTPSSIGRARILLAGYIASGHVAIQGSGGDGRTYAVCAEVLNLGLSIDKALEIIEPWNDACVPRWDIDDLRVKFENASQYAQNDQGAWVVQPLSDRLPAGALDKLLADSLAVPQEQPSGIVTNAGEWTFGLHDPVADAELPPVTYRDRNRLWPDSQGKTVSQVIAPPKCQKTNWLMAEKFRLMLHANAKVLMLALEGGYGVRTMRLKALAAHYQVPLPDLRGRFQIVEVKAGGMFDMSDPPCVIAFADFVKAGAWTDVFIDTQHRSAGALDENSATDARLFWNAVEVLRRRGNVNVTLAHHTGKDVTKGGRGSSADLASVDQQISLEFDRGTMTVTAKVTARKDGADGFEVPFKVIQANENSVPILEPITAAEAAALVASKETYTSRAVANVLAALEAVGQARHVTSPVVVQDILIRRKELPEDPDLAKTLIANGVKRLHEKLKKDGGLQAYARRAGTSPTSPWIWYLPDTPVEAWPRA